MLEGTFMAGAREGMLFKSHLTRGTRGAQEVEHLSSTQVTISGLLGWSLTSSSTL